MEKAQPGGNEHTERPGLRRPEWFTSAPVQTRSNLLQIPALETVPREVLWLQAGEVATEALHGLSPGWRLRAVSLEHNQTPPDAGQARVGLLSLGECRYSVVRQLMQSTPSVKWIALIRHELLADEKIRALICEGCYDYHTLPLDLARLEIALGRAHGMAELEKSSEPGTLTWASPDGTRLIGSSAPMQKLFHHLRRVAQSDVPVLIQGESGTGKELAALTMHRNSRRAGGPFVAVNCGALPAQLIQSELFGHEAGAFTGAVKRKHGQFELANGGTLLLDEIGDLSLDLQVNLLRFLQEHSLFRLGGTKPIPVDIRVFAATHVDLAEAVRKGHFREDLYYRLNVIQVDMPPLRERGNDLERLAKYYLERFRGQNIRLRGFTQGAIETMYQHAWPGNVRELANRIQRAVALADGHLIAAEDLGLSGGRSVVPTLADARAQAERESVEHALRESTNNVTRAARRLGIGRVTLYRLINKYEINLSQKPRA